MPLVWGQRDMNMVAEESVYRKRVWDLSVMTIHTTDIALHALSSEDTYSSENKTFPSSQVPPSLQKWSANYSKKETCEFGTFVNLIVQLNSICATSAMTAHTYTAIWHLVESIPLQWQYVGTFRAHIIPSFYQKCSAHSLYKSCSAFFKQDGIIWTCKLCQPESFSGMVSARRQLWQ